MSEQAAPAEASASEAAAAAENRRNGGPRSYYGQPVIKEPVWTPEIPFYFFTGGLGGASAGLAWLAERRGSDELARRAWAAALGGVGVSPLLLISDLGVPARFLNMLRMFKVTSPMSVGTWILSASGAATGVAAANAWLGTFPGLAPSAKATAALLGLPLSTYTAALVANTSVPTWHGARRTLPFAFAAGAATSAGAVVTAITPPGHAAPARRLAIAGAVAEITATEVMERQLGEAGGPYHEGPAGILSKVAKGLTALGAGIIAARGHTRGGAIAGGAVLAAGALAARSSVFRAGFQSASDPAYTVGPQRERIDRGEARGAARTQASSALAATAAGTSATAAATDVPTAQPMDGDRPED